MDADLPRCPAVPTAHSTCSSAPRPPPAGLAFLLFPRLDADYRDFFDRDIGTPTPGFPLRGRALAWAGLDRNRWGLRLASLLDENRGLPHEGFYYSSRGDWAAARDCFRASADTHESCFF